LKIEINNHNTTSQKSKAANSLMLNYPQIQEIKQLLFHLYTKADGAGVLGCCFEYHADVRVALLS
jgi:hypothetical protein